MNIFNYESYAWLKFINSVAVKWEIEKIVNYSNIEPCTSAPRDCSILLADVSANTHLRSLQLHVNIVQFLILMGRDRKKCSTSKLDSAYDWLLQNCKLGMGKKNTVIGYSWLFVNRREHSYKERMHVSQEFPNNYRQMLIFIIASLALETSEPGSPNVHSWKIKQRKNWRA